MKIFYESLSIFCLMFLIVLPVNSTDCFDNTDFDTYDLNQCVGTCVMVFDGCLAECMCGQTPCSVTVCRNEYLSPGVSRFQSLCGGVKSGHYCVGHLTLFTTKKDTITPCNIVTYDFSCPECSMGAPYGRCYSNCHCDPATSPTFGHCSGHPVQQTGFGTCV